MANKAKAKGTTFESAVVKCLEEYGITSRRTAMSGSADNGDLEITEPFLAIVECKAYKGELAEKAETGFREETLVEAQNYKKAFRLQEDVKGLLIVKTPGQSINRAKVSFFNTRYNCWLSLRLCEFVESWEELIKDMR